MNTVNNYHKTSW